MITEVLISDVNDRVRSLCVENKTEVLALCIACYFSVFWLDIICTFSELEINRKCLTEYG